MTLTMTKVELLKRMDECARLKFEDEEIFEYWLTYGVPDGSDEEDLIELANDHEDWVNIVKCFSECARRAGII